MYIDLKLITLKLRKMRLPTEMGLGDGEEAIRLGQKWDLRLKQKTALLLRMPN